MYRFQKDQGMVSHRPAEAMSCHSQCGLRVLSLEVEVVFQYLILNLKEGIMEASRDI
jgi:hypothetical protein